MRTLSNEEMAAVGGGIEEITVIGYRDTWVTTITDPFAIDQLLEQLTPDPLGYGFGDDFFGGGGTNENEDDCGSNGSGSDGANFTNPTGGEVRSNDPLGGGQFGDSRGSRPHNGTDYDSVVGQDVGSVIGGTVSKIGYSYLSGEGGVNSSDPYRYVEVTKDNYSARVHYVDPSVRIGDAVSAGQKLGTSQDLGGRYPGIHQHNHVEIKEDSQFIDPETVISGTC